MPTRHLAPRRKIWLTSICVGIAVALLAGSIQFMVIYHNRAERFDAIIHNVHTYLQDYFHDLNQTIQGMQPLVDQPCENVASGLTAHAAFSPNVRAILLVKNGPLRFCSSATGAMNTPLIQLIPQLNLTQAVDMAILPGTPMMPKSAALALWVRSPHGGKDGIFVSINANLTPYILYSARQNDFSGLALAINDTAISTFSNHLSTRRRSLRRPRQTQIDGLPLKVYLYANSWLAENTQFALLLGVVCGLLAGLLSYYILTIKSDPRKELLLAIKNDQFYVVYQPVVRSETLQISGIEVLMRWRHPVAGEIPPDVFINLAETQQIIIPLTRHLLKLIAQDAPVLQTLLPRREQTGDKYLPPSSACRQLSAGPSALRRRHAGRPF